MSKRLSIIDTCKSVLWALLGVQSDANREQDFKHGSASQFIFVGLVAVILFVLGLVRIVNIVLS